MTQKKINIALYQPDIPQNTAAIIRVAACLNTCLHIIKPTGFVFNEKKINRIYMDYIKHCEIKFFDSIEEFLLKKAIDELFFLQQKQLCHMLNLNLKVMIFCSLVTKLMVFRNICTTL